MPVSRKRKKQKSLTKEKRRRETVSERQVRNNIKELQYMLDELEKMEK
jgi:hypothetical protein